MRSLSAVITYGGRPLPGVAVEVRGFGGEKDNSKLFSTVTALNGKVNVGDLPPGNYWLYTDLLGISAGSQCFHVAPSASRTAKKRIAYEWGDLAPGVGRMTGRLVDSQPSHGGSPISNLNIYARLYRVCRPSELPPGAPSQCAILANTVEAGWMQARIDGLPGHTFFPAAR